MTALIALLIFFRLIQEEKPKCPPPQREIVEKWVPAEEGYKYWVAEHLKTNPGETKFFVAATTTWRNGQAMIMIPGTTTDQNAVEHNKRVYECQTINGDF